MPTQCFVGGVLVGGLLSRLSLFFLMISSDLDLTTIQDLSVLGVTTMPALNYLGLAWLSGPCDRAGMVARTKRRSDTP